MILDKLENASLYSFNDKFRLAFNFLLSNDLESLPACRLHLQGDDIVVSIVDMEGNGEQVEDLEAHHEFADIHYLVSGEEKMAWKPQDDCMQQKDSYNEQKDEERFTDVPSSSYYADAVTWAVRAGVTSGMTPTTFEPTGTVTRAQAVSFLWRAVGQPAPYRSYNPFNDVPSDTWYTNAVLWAVEQGIVYGTTETTFEPNSPVTREQMLTFLARTQGVEASGSDVYKIAVAWAEGKGLLNGIPGEFISKAPCPRCEVVYYIWQLQP